MKNLRQHLKMEKCSSYVWEDPALRISLPFWKISRMYVQLQLLKRILIHFHMKIIWRIRLVGLKDSKSLVVGDMRCLCQNSPIKLNVLMDIVLVSMWLNLSKQKPFRRKMQPSSPHAWWNKCNSTRLRQSGSHFEVILNHNIRVESTGFRQV